MNQFFKGFSRFFNDEGALNKGDMHWMQFHLVMFKSLAKFYHQRILLLAERALSRDYSVKMWSSKTLYLTASRAEGHYS